MASAGKRDHKYHAFLSFRGPDTRNNFVGHLYERLTSKGIYAFKDDQRLETGRSISLEIVNAIKDSSVFVVVLSENYASSSWCLDELVEILECCKEGSRNAVLPVFYKVDPSYVRKLKGSFGAALKEHERSFEEEKVRRWREDLTKVAGLCGWDSRNRDEATFLADIVTDISNKVNLRASSFDDRDIVGMGSQVKKMLKLLCINSDEVRFVGIWGMSGVGKSTLARIIYNQIYTKFGGYWFFGDVGRKYKGYDAATSKKELLSNILQEKELTGWPLDKHFSIIKDKLCKRKVLIVLDDVDDLEQLQVLAQNPEWFGPGSRNIITTRDRQLLVAHGVEFIHETMPLKTNVALQLFSQSAFKQNQPRDDYLELSHNFVSYAESIPLFLKVLGSRLYNRGKDVWQSELDKLRMHPNGNILKVLKVSYDELEDIDRGVFLDIACFFNGMKKDKVRNILDGCGFFSDSAFDILESKAMLSIANDRLSMHGLFSQMGQDIVRQECEDPGGRSRWWNPNDIYNCLTKGEGTKKVKGIFLNMSESREMCLSCKAFKNMKNLRLLEFCYSPSQCAGDACNVKLRGECLDSLSNQLRYLHWDAFPATEFPSDFSPEYLVELHLPYSKLTQLWKGEQPLGNLKLLDLRHSKSVVIPDLSKAEKLESLNLQNCEKLVDVSSIEYLSKLECLNLSGCTNLVSLPNLGGLKFLTTLDLSNCSSLQELPPSIECLSGLRELDLRNCTSLMNPQNISELKYLRKVDIGGCVNLLELSSQNQIGESTNRSLVDSVSSNGLNSTERLDEGWSMEPVSEHYSGRVEEIGEHDLAVGRQNHDELEEEDEDRNKGGGGKEAVNAEEKKRKRFSLDNELNEFERENLIAVDTSEKHVEKPVDQRCSSDGSSLMVAASLLNHKSGGESARSLSTTTVSSFKTNHSEGSSFLDRRVSNCSARSLLGGDSITLSKSNESILKALQGQQSLLHQSPEQVDQSMGALSANLPFVKNQTVEVGISPERQLLYAESGGEDGYRG